MVRKIGSAWSRAAIRIPPGFYILRVAVNSRGKVASIHSLRFYETEHSLELKDASKQARNGFRRLLRVLAQDVHLKERRRPK